jgi:hypothetical protein
MSATIEINANELALELAQEIAYNEDNTRQGMVWPLEPTLAIEVYHQLKHMHLDPVVMVREDKLAVTLTNINFIMRFSEQLGNFDSMERGEKLMISAERLSLLLTLQWVTDEIVTAGSFLERRNELKRIIKDLNVLQD